MNLIFDCGKVLFFFDPKTIIRHFFDGSEEDAALIEQAVFTFERWGKLDTGEIDEKGLAELAKPYLPERLYNIAEMITRNWFHAMPEIKGMRELIGKYKAEGHRIYLLSNISLGFAAHYREVPEIASLFSLFDGLVFSAELRMIKPDRRIFEYVLEKYELDRKDTVFIDDAAKNIEGAEKAGIRGILFTDAEALVSELSSPA